MTVGPGKTSDKLADFFATGRQKQYAGGELVASGEAPPGVFYVESGFVKVYSISDAGDRYVHLLYKHGDIFPLIWAIKGTRRRIFYEADGPVNARMASKADFLRFLRTDKDAACQMLERVVNQFHIYADRLDNLQYKPANQRVIYRLLHLAGRFGTKEGGKVIINAPITHELIAETINLTRETVSREIEKLEKQGLLSRRGGLIVLKDVKELSSQFSEPASLDLWGLE